MKKLLKVLAGITVVLGLIIAVAYARGDGYLLKGLWATYLHGYSSASIGDAVYFDTKPIDAGSDKQPWTIAHSYNQQPLSDELRKSLEDTRSVAYLVIQNDSILSEHYWDGYSDSSQSNSFSAAKSIVTMLAQIAIQKGALKGWNQKVKTLIPELTGPYADKVKLWHLSTMSSGMEWDESYKDPFSISAKAYYGNDVNKVVTALPIITEPGKEFNYQSGSTQLLGICIMKATGKPLSQLASEWLWKPLHAERDAVWHTDDAGVEMAYCCFNTNARDFARFGKMMLNQGNWNGEQILDSAFVAKATSGALVPYYGYSFWIDESEGTKVFYQRGILGQYIIVVPEYNAVIVRLGHKRVERTGDEHHNKDFRIIVKETLKVLKAQPAS